jgi:hypothetical protein
MRPEKREGRGVAGLTGDMRASPTLKLATS